MTIEIKQLVIRASVEPRPGGAARQAPAPETGPQLPVPPPAARAEGPEGTAPLDALVDACTRQVLRALRKQRSR